MMISLAAYSEGFFKDVFDEKGCPKTLFPREAGISP